MNIKNVLLTGGRAPATLHLARILRENGCDVFVADSIPFTFTKKSNMVKKNFLITSPVHCLEKFKNDILEIFKNEKIDLIIPTCEETFYISKIKNSFPKGSVFTSEIEKMRMLHSKYEFILSLEEYRNYISIPKTYILKNQKELEGIDFKERVFKPVFSRFGNDVIFSKNDKIDLDFNLGREWVCQEKIEGYQVCSYAITNNGNVKAYSCYKTEFSHGLGATVLFEPHANERIYEFVKKYVDDLNFTGQISFDFIINKDGNVFPIECNPRTTSGICLFDGKTDIKSSFFDEENCNIYIGEKSFMLALPTLSVILKEKRWSSLKKWKTTRDVVFNKKDKKPSFYQIYMFFKFYMIARKNKVSITASTTIDIEWGGEI